MQEYIGYCLIPSNKGQRMMVIKGNGGEGKSQIGAVLGTLFGSNMKDGSIGKISENRFARADLDMASLTVVVEILLSSSQIEMVPLLAASSVVAEAKAEAPLELNFSRTTQPSVSL